MYSEQMRELRLAAGLLGKEVAAEMGVSAETVSRWERGVYVISQVVEESFRRLVTDPLRCQGIRAGRRRRRLAARLKARDEEI